MSEDKFNPLEAFCINWRKIDPRFNLTQHKKFRDLSTFKCAECNSCANLRYCAGCHITAYCSTFHQKLHWTKKHRYECCPFKILRDETSELRGRYLVATRDIHPGEIILEEPPITAGPKQFSGRVCLGCHVPIRTIVYRCSKCSWPLCSSECETRILHSLIECHTLSSLPFKPSTQKSCSKHDNPSIPTEDESQDPIYECITPLRCLLVKKIRTENYELMLKMEQHTDLRKSEPMYQINQVNTVNFLLENIPEFPDTFSVDEINAVINLLDVNAFEIRGENFSIRGVYPLTAMMNAVCCPNTQNCIDEAFICRVRATVFIPKGNEITATYTTTLSNTLYRRKYLLESKYFECKCNRCADPTELNSHNSTLLCDQCDTGYVLPIDSLVATSNWKCTSCPSPKLISWETITDLVTKTENAISLLSSNPQDHEVMLENLKSKFHHQHQVMLELKFNLLYLYGRNGSISHWQALRKVEVCQDILKVIAILMPGLHRLTGVVLTNMASAQLFLLKKNIKYEMLEKNTKKIRASLQEAIKILSFEPLKTPEAKACTSAKALLRNLDKVGI